MAKQNKKPTQVPASKPNQKRIDKLTELAKNSSEDDIQHKPHIASKNIDHIIKLNEELTAENSRLLERCDVLESSAEVWCQRHQLIELELKDVNENYQELILINKQLVIGAKDRLDKAKKSEEELSVIKSKWWYKLMTWGWK